MDRIVSPGLMTLSLYVCVRVMVQFVFLCIGFKDNQLHLTFLWEDFHGEFPHGNLVEACKYQGLQTDS